eukprot:357645-Chlamydomonas_euryale.AAC.3
MQRSAGVLVPFDMAAAACLHNLHFDMEEQKSWKHCWWLASLPNNLMEVEHASAVGAPRGVPAWWWCSVSQRSPCSAPETGRIYSQACIYTCNPPHAFVAEGRGQSSAVVNVATGVTPAVLRATPQFTQVCFPSTTP